MLYCSEPMIGCILIVDIYEVDGNSRIVNDDGMAMGGGGTLLLGFIHGIFKILFSPKYEGKTGLNE